MNSPYRVLKFKITAAYNPPWPVLNPIFLIVLTLET